MPLDEIKALITGMLDRLDTLDATVKFDFKEDGILFVDATESPAVLSHDDDLADCTIKVSPGNLEKILQGRLDPMLAYTMGRLKIKGSTGTATKLTGLLKA